MTIRRFAALALALVVGLTACGGDGGREQAIADLVAAGWSEAEATCYVDATIEVAGTDALDPGADLTPERLDALYQVASTCRLTAVSSPSGTSTTPSRR